MNHDKICTARRVLYRSVLAKSRVKIIMYRNEGYEIKMQCTQIDENKPHAG